VIALLSVPASLLELTSCCFLFSLSPHSPFGERTSGRTKMQYTPLKKRHNRTHVATKAEASLWTMTSDLNRGLSVVLANRGCEFQRVWLYETRSAQTKSFLYVSNQTLGLTLTCMPVTSMNIYLEYENTRIYRHGMNYYACKIRWRRNDAKQREMRRRPVRRRTTKDVNASRPPT